MSKANIYTQCQDKIASLDIKPINVQQGNKL